MKYFVALILVGVVSAGAVMADGDAGTESPFAFGAGARDLSMGGAALATGDVTTAPFWNPARLAQAQHYALGGFHSRLYDEDVAYQYLGLAVPTLDFGTFGAGVFRLGIDGIEKRDAGNVVLGEFDDSRLGLLFAYAKALGGYDFGLSVMFEHHSLDDYSATSSPGVTVAAARRFELNSKNLPSITAAVNVRNAVKPTIELSQESVSYPPAGDLGITAVLVPKVEWQQRLAVSAAVEKVDGVEAAFRAGAEYSFRDLLFVRGGLRNGKASFGAGLEYGPIRFDYALVDRELGSLHMVNLTTSFGKSVADRREERILRREAEFNTLMSNRLSERNRAQLESLLDQATEQFNAGNFPGAFSSYDRALFVARANGMDTTQIHQQREEVRRLMDWARSKQLYADYIDSVRTHYREGNYLAARYFAGLALREDPQSDQARNVLRKVDSILAVDASWEDMIEHRLQVADSLVAYGDIEKALGALADLETAVPDNQRVRKAIKRAEFEKWRTQAAEAQLQGYHTAALAALDSALARFPGHAWCLEMKGRVRREMADASSRVSTPPAERRQGVELSAEVRHEVAQTYKTAQEYFRQGDLQQAIAQWEKVERMAPGYQSVREYLVNAYKYVGIELYGQSKLTEAIAVLRKASVLAPDNGEIAGYLERTETELRKLRELSYEHE